MQLYCPVLYWQVVLKRRTDAAPPAAAGGAGKKRRLAAFDARHKKGDTIIRFSTARCLLPPVGCSAVLLASIASICVQGRDWAAAERMQRVPCATA